MLFENSVLSIDTYLILEHSIQQMATPCPPDITCWWLSGVPYLGSGRKCLSIFTRLKCSRAWGSLVRISAQAWGGESVVCGVLCCSWAFGFHALSFIPNPEKRISLPTYRALYQEFIAATTVIELGFSFVQYVVSIIHFEVLCVHLWFPVDRLSLVFLFSKLGSTAQENGQVTTSAWKSKFSYEVRDWLFVCIGALWAFVQTEHS